MASGSLSAVTTPCLCSSSKKVRQPGKPEEEEKDGRTAATSGLSSCNRDERLRVYVLTSHCRGRLLPTQRYEQQLGLRDHFSGTYYGK